MYEFYYRFLLIKATWGIASAAIGLEPIGHTISNKYLYRCWAVDWAMWAVGWLRDGLRLWPWAGYGVAYGWAPWRWTWMWEGLQCGPPSPWGPLPTPQPAHKYVIHTNKYIFNANLYMSSFRIFFRASGATEAAAYRGRPIRRTYRGATAYTTASPGWPQHIK